ncbi:hypothetical protein KZ820_20805 [Sphingomonas sp. RRHST34]|uniref:Uncharacterized protein n=1 Tax=Sphingomonas citri TaxID=2862499 RepID=A0ABS7BUB4_9SPHN|nr:hypothetical protein [Sphingomonas citri]MBW6533189.1 hypothetical protein [Sphingomonas citri]
MIDVLFYCGMTVALFSGGGYAVGMVRIQVAVFPAILGVVAMLLAILLSS